MWLDFLSAFLQKFLEVVLPVLATAVAGLVIAWITKVINDIKAKLTDDQIFVVNEVVRSAVLAAEQVHLKDAAIDKKNYALNIAESWLVSKGIKLDPAYLDAKIEAAVMDEFNLSRVDGLAKTANAGND